MSKFLLVLILNFTKKVYQTTHNSSSSDYSHLINSLLTIYRRWFYIAKFKTHISLVLITWVWHLFVGLLGLVKNTSISLINTDSTHILKSIIYFHSCPIHFCFILINILRLNSKHNFITLWDFTLLNLIMNKYYKNILT